MGKRLATNGKRPFSIRPFGLSLSKARSRLVKLGSDSGESAWRWS